MGGKFGTVVQLVVIFPFGCSNSLLSQAEKDWTSTPLVCASAGWGVGSYVVVTGTDQVVNIATTGTVTRKTADLFCIKEGQQN